MSRFAFVIHPLRAKDAARKYPFLKPLPDPLIEGIMRRMKPKVASEITGVVSKTGAKTEGVFIGCPYTPRQFLNLPVEEVYEKIVDCARVAEEEGCEIIGLGAFTSVVGDGGITVAQRSNIAVTTGNSYTVATAIDGAVEACRLVGIDPAVSRLAVVGATGSIGKTCAEVLSRQFSETILVGRDMEKTALVGKEIDNSVATTDIARIRDADLVVSVTSSDAALILPEHLKTGSVICDVARPRDVSVRVGRERPDVLVIEGGVVSVPGDVKFNFDFGFPERTAYACMSETMMLALEDGPPKSLTLGKDVSVEQVDETRRLAEKHGFKVSGFRSFERAVGQDALDRVRAARESLAGPVPTAG